MAESKDQEKFPLSRNGLVGIFLIKSPTFNKTSNLLIDFTRISTKGSYECKLCSHYRHAPYNGAILHPHTSSFEST